MIPKIIHYCWFGQGKKPYLIRKCLKSWQRVMPDYDIKEWNEDNFDINMMPFVSQAYRERKWAFVADVCRFYACYHEGGIYLDTDVEVFRRFDEFLNDNFFIGTEVQSQKGGVDNVISIDASVFGCEQGNKFALECLNFYHDKSFYLPDGKITGGTVQAVATRIIKSYGYIQENKRQFIKEWGGINIYPTAFFTNVTEYRDRKDSIYSLHHFDGSWVDKSNRGFIYKFCRRYDLMRFYNYAERVFQRYKFNLKK